jgi:hypothetical protein
MIGVKILLDNNSACVIIKSDSDQGAKLPAEGSLLGVGRSPLSSGGRRGGNRASTVHFRTSNHKDKHTEKIACIQYLIPLPLAAQSTYLNGAQP